MKLNAIGVGSNCTIGVGVGAISTNASVGDCEEVIITFDGENLVGHFQFLFCRPVCRDTLMSPYCRYVNNYFQFISHSPSTPMQPNRAIPALTIAGLSISRLSALSSCVHPCSVLNHRVGLWRSLACRIGHRCWYWSSANFK